MPLMIMIKSGLKEQWRQNYSIDLLTTREGCIHVFLAAMVMSKYVQPLILCGPGYVTSHLGNVEPNLKQVVYTK